MVSRKGALGPWRQEVTPLWSRCTNWLYVVSQLAVSLQSFLNDCVHAQYPQEDVMLRRLIKEHGVKKWSSVAEGIPGRSGKSCRLR